MNFESGGEMEVLGTGRVEMLLARMLGDGKKWYEVSSKIDLL